MPRQGGVEALAGGKKNLYKKKPSKKLLKRKSSEKKHSKKNHSKKKLSKKKHSGVKKDEKSHKCHVNYEPCNKVPEPLVVKNMDCLKKFWDERNYKYTLNFFFQGISSKYPNGYSGKGYGKITHKDNYRIHMSITSYRYIKNKKNFH